jgi:hypothetical protein
LQQQLGPELRALLTIQWHTRPQAKYRITSPLRHQPWFSSLPILFGITVKLTDVPTFGAAGIAVRVQVSGHWRQTADYPILRRYC